MTATEEEFVIQALLKVRGVQCGFLTGQHYADILNPYDHIPKIAVARNKLVEGDRGVYFRCEDHKWGGEKRITTVKELVSIPWTKQ